MAETPSTPPTATAAPATAAATAPAIKKGSLVKVNRKAYEGSLEAQASAGSAPGYLFEGPAEVLLLKGDYAQLRFRRPVPDVWLRLDQLESA